ncbi:MAG: hypothetical protein WD031_00630, partial [Gemmatimonadota bacterium]
MQYDAYFTFPRRLGRSGSLLALSALLLGPPAVLAQAHEHPAGAPETVGRVAFETSCSPAVAERIERAVAMLHSFWFDSSLDAFGEVAEADSNCAMAHWGIAMTEMGNPMAR